MGKEQDLLDHVLGLPDLESIRGHPDKLIAVIDEHVKKVRMMIIGQYKGAFIVEKIREREPTIMIELGCYVGYSAILFGAEVAKCNASISKSGCTPGKYYSFELNEEYANIARQLIDIAGLSDCVEIIVGPAGQTLPDFEARLSEETRKYTSLDVVFIDHWKDAYVPDLRVLESLGLIGPGTLLLADNIFMPGAPDYVKYVQGTPEERREHNVNVPNDSNKVYEGRWNLMYESETVPFTNPENGHEDAVEVTKCTAFLLG